MRISCSAPCHCRKTSRSSTAWAVAYSGRSSAGTPLSATQSATYCSVAAAKASGLGRRPGRALGCRVPGQGCLQALERLRAADPPLVEEHHVVPVGHGRVEVAGVVVRDRDPGRSRTAGGVRDHALARAAQGALDGERDLPCLAAGLRVIARGSDGHAVESAALAAGPLADEHRVRLEQDSGRRPHPDANGHDQAEQDQRTAEEARHPRHASSRPRALETLPPGRPSWYTTPYTRALRHARRKAPPKEGS